MVHKFLYMLLIFIVFSTMFTNRGSAFTDPADVAALRALYETLNRPLELENWNLGDPCAESWTGVACSGSSVIHLKIQGLNLTGNLGTQLHNLQNLKMLDVSSNNIQGEVPYNLPPNATHINMAHNYLRQKIPHTLPMLTRLRHLNLSNNLLSGPIGNVFTGLDDLIEMDLSYNNFTGDLPSSFGSLKSLNRLFLQNNNFTGSVAYLADLPLTDLNIQGNLFSGIIPWHFQLIPNLWMGGNKFHVESNSPPWNFPLDRELDSYVGRPPMTHANVIENYSSHKVSGHKKKLVNAGELAFMVGGGTLIVTGLAIFFAIRTKQLNKEKLQSFQSSHGSLQSDAIIINIDDSPIVRKESPRTLQPVTSTSLMPPRPCPPQSQYIPEDMPRRSFSRRHRFSGRTKMYSEAELQKATNSFSEENFLGEGSVGSVYRAVFPNGRTLAVKKISMIGISFYEEETFLDAVSISSRMRHPNIVELNGYCLEHGQRLLVYEYVRNLTLHDALHSGAFMPLSWPLRLRIALGVGQALNYMHSAFSTPVAHGKLTAANILLDENMMPRVCDCGLVILRPMMSYKVKVPALAAVDRGYISPDHGQLAISNPKNDVYAFGVLLLELLTGKAPYDGSKPKEEQFLGKWALGRLHDNESLEQMVDPKILGAVSTKVLSCYAHIVSLCIQPVKEFRPMMSMVLDSLTICSEQLTTADGPKITDSDPLDLSFHSAYTRFPISPAHTYESA